MISWFRKENSSVSLNVAEAEYITSFSTTCEEIWLRKLMSRIFDMEVDTTVIFCDNQSSIKMKKNMVFQDKSKRMEIQYFYMLWFFMEHRIFCHLYTTLFVTENYYGVHLHVKYSWHKLLKPYRFTTSGASYDVLFFSCTESNNGLFLTKPWDHGGSQTITTTWGALSICNTSCPIWIRIYIEYVVMISIIV